MTLADKAREEALAFRAEVVDKVASLAAAAFGLVAALAWNEAIQSVFRHYFGPSGSIPGLLAYAALVTLIAVGVTLWIGRTAARLRGEWARAEGAPPGGMHR